jgi:hypothetical protein
VTLTRRRYVGTTVFGVVVVLGWTTLLLIFVVALRGAALFVVVLGLVARVVAVATVLGHTHPVDVLYGSLMGCMWAIRVVDGP